MNQKEEIKQLKKTNKKLSKALSKAIEIFEPLCDHNASLWAINDMIEALEHYCSKK